MKHRGTLYLCSTILAGTQPRKNEGEGGNVTVTEEITTFPDGSEIVETKTVESEYIPSEESAETVAEIIAEEPGEIEAPLSDAVAIAAIEAEAEVAVAEIRAEVEIAAIEAEAERERTWQEEIADLQANMRTLEAQLAALTQPPVEADPLTLPALTEAEAVEPSDLTPQSTPELTSETLTEALPASEDEKPVAETPAKRRPRRLI
jgi:hypothetical protein